MARANRQRWTTHAVERPTRADALRANVAAGQAVVETVRSTLGPNGRDKMLVGSDGTVVVTNDGASILDRLDVDDPTARMIVEVAAAQDGAVGDGTTTAVLLTGKLLAEAAELADEGLHPTTIVSGYHHAAVHARERLGEYGIGIEGDDETLRAVARTAVTGKWDDASAERFADLAVRGVRAVETDGGVDVRDLTLTALPGGELRASELVDGLLVDMDISSTSIEGFDAGLPQRFADVRIALVNDEIAVETADAVGTVTVTDPEQLERLREHESGTRADVVRTITDFGVDVLFCQKSIDDAVQTALGNEGVLTVERTRQDELDALARTTAATVVPSVGDLASADIGRAGSVTRHSAGPSELLTIADCPKNTHASLLLRGGTEHVAEETRRIVEDCIAVVQLALDEGFVLPGGGAIEMALAQDLSTHAAAVDGREQLAVEAFAEALKGIPRTLVANAGLDPVDVLADLRHRHHEQQPSVGVDPTTGELRDMRQARVLEPRSVTDRCLASALAATSMILRIDEIVRSGAGASHDDEHDHESAGYGQQSTDGYPWAIGH